MLSNVRDCLRSERDTSAGYDLQPYILWCSEILNGPEKKKSDAHRKN